MKSDTPGTAMTLLFDDLVVGQCFGEFVWEASRERADAWRRTMGESVPNDAEADAFPAGLLVVMYSNYMDARCPPRPPGMIYAKQALRFSRHPRVAEVLTTRMTVHDKYSKRGRRFVELATSTVDQHGRMVVEGLRTVVWGA